MSDLQAEMLGVIEHAIANAPRSLQKAIGPSEIGHPCARRIAYKLAGAPEVNTGRVPWKPAIGTAVHAWLDETFTAANARQPDFDTTGGRYLCEVRVDVGEIAGQTITGSCDLRTPEESLDFKIVGDPTLRRVKKEQHPGQQYRIQGHLYGRGWQRMGRPVKTIGVWFLPRNQELRQAYLWTEPYDEQVAIEALARAESIASLVQRFGVAAAGALPMTEAYCSGCPFFRANSTDLTQGCPGVIKAKDPAAEFAGLLAS
ncbi:hypothetical protein [Actinomadura montaniterrae]|uniref:PD-(D/E)XK nuclease family protein n=1 Tax=Actinomadura montaniterrae TaxID=1803903 RepID=A0A6L3W2F0_9ACTN|nr:hypothetical protein [Actinomadura montaniterrae]KAB2384733.1 hypothetical protein F9B16_09810 [Actinomadura montaniterrae]